MKLTVYTEPDPNRTQLQVMTGDGTVGWAYLEDVAAMLAPEKLLISKTTLDKVMNNIHTSIPDGEGDEYNDDDAIEALNLLEKEMKEQLK